MTDNDFTEGAQAGSAPAGAPVYLTREQLEQINSDLTVGDTFRATIEAQGDNARAGMLAFLYGARRLGLVDPATELEGFLDRVRQVDFLAVLSPEARDPKSLESTD